MSSRLERAQTGQNVARWRLDRGEEEFWKQRVSLAMLADLARHAVGIMNYDGFCAAWDEALRRANLLSFHDRPEEVIDTKAMACRYTIRLGMSHRQPAEPFFGSMELRWEWDALTSARAQTIEEDVVAELLGRENAKNNQKRVDAGCQPLFSQVQRYCMPRCAEDAWRFKKTIRHREMHPDAPYRGRSR